MDLRVSLVAILYERWPTSGIVSDGVCLTVKTSESPNHAVESTLLEVIETGEVPSRYFLIPRAEALADL